MTKTFLFGLYPLQINETNKKRHQNKEKEIRNKIILTCIFLSYYISGKIFMCHNGKSSWMHTQYV